MQSFLLRFILAIVFVVFLIVGFLYKKRPNSIREYALGNRAPDAFTLAATMIATCIGGGTLVAIPDSLFRDGIWLFLSLCAVPMSYCLVSLFIVPKLSKFYGCLSIAETMGRMYGSSVRRFVGIAAIAFCIGILSVQLRVLYWVMERVFGQSAVIATSIALFAVVLYSSLGGVRSVIKTDILQFFMFVVALPQVAYLMLDSSGGLHDVIANIPAEKFIIFSEGHTIYGLLALFALNLIPDLAPHTFHRLLIGRDRRKNQVSLYMLAFILVIILMFTGLVMFIAFARFPNIEPRLLIFHVLDNFAANKVIVISFTLGLIAVIASTADSAINTSTIIFVNDVLDTEVPEKLKMYLLHWCAIICGGVASVIAFNFGNLLDIVWFVLEYYTLIVIVPFIAGVYRKVQNTSYAYWLSVSVGIIFFTIFHLLPKNVNHEIFLISLVASVIAYLVAIRVEDKYYAMLANAKE